MRRFSKVALSGALALAAVALLGAGGPPKVGDVAPPFELTLIDGSKVSSDALRGQVVVLNFWATWCGPCKKELPTLDTYYELQKTHGLKVFTIATEDSLPLYQLKKLFAVMHMPSARRIKGNYPILSGVPTNYIIDRSGHVRYAKAAAFDLDSLNAELVPLLREPAPPAPQS
ncbi:TlpA family protein disulfide reductase [Sphingomonas sp. TF3]|uniref:TlpA family protein disulfide reductase n=1 Tax=Sphingomonas sp. TF3 TaxID=2495580 RepID=UPI000F871419|nr:TlpA disulfide reductase family protein [Sphingomonas sp. TF3]RUN76600.1 TlpA family protein disulfide reductase [Sphingomonas sp. TF3]